MIFSYLSVFLSIHLDSLLAAWVPIYLAIGSPRSTPPPRRMARGSKTLGRGRMGVYSAESRLQDLHVFLIVSVRRRIVEGFCDFPFGRRHP